MPSRPLNHSITFLSLGPRHRVVPTHVQIVHPSRHHRQTTRLFNNFLRALRRHTPVAFTTHNKGRHRMRRAGFINTRVNNRHAGQHTRFFGSGIRHIQMELTNTLFLRTRLLNSRFLSRLLLTVSPLRVKTHNTMRAIRGQPITNHQ